MAWQAVNESGIKEHFLLAAAELCIRRLEVAKHPETASFSGTQSSSMAYRLLF
jgi:hypothetical protein